MSEEAEPVAMAVGEEEEGTDVSSTEVLEGGNKKLKVS